MLKDMEVIYNQFKITSLKDDEYLVQSETFPHKINFLVQRIMPDGQLSLPIWHDCKLLSKYRDEKRAVFQFRYDFARFFLNQN